MIQPTQTPITGREVIDSSGSPLAALIQFYRAFNSRDMAEMEMSWENSADISMDNPLGGIKRGWDEIRAVYDRIFNGPARVYVEYYDYTIHIHGELFYAVGRERGRFEKGGNVIDLAIRTSRIFRKTDAGWKQVHHHGSIENPELLDRYQKGVQ